MAEINKEILASRLRYEPIRDWVSQQKLDKPLGKAGHTAACPLYQYLKACDPEHEYDVHEDTIIVFVPNHGSFYCTPSKLAHRVIKDVDEQFGTDVVFPQEMLRVLEENNFDDNDEEYQEEDDE